MCGCIDVKVYEKEHHILRQDSDLFNANEDDNNKNANSKYHIQYCAMF